MLAPCREKIQTLCGLVNALTMADWGGMGQACETCIAEITDLAGPAFMDKALSELADAFRQLNANPGTSDEAKKNMLNALLERDPLSRFPQAAAAQAVPESPSGPDNNATVPAKSAGTAELKASKAAGVNTDAPMTQEDERMFKALKLMPTITRHLNQLGQPHSEVADLIELVQQLEEAMPRAGTALAAPTRAVIKMELTLAIDAKPPGLLPFTPQVQQLYFHAQPLPNAVRDASQALSQFIERLNTESAAMIEKKIFVEDMPQMINRIICEGGDFKAELLQKLAWGLKVLHLTHPNEVIRGLMKSMHEAYFPPHLMLNGTPLPRHPWMSVTEKESLLQEQMIFLCRNAKNFQAPLATQFCSDLIRTIKSGGLKNPAEILGIFYEKLDKLTQRPGAPQWVQAIQDSLFA